MWRNQPNKSHPQFTSPTSHNTHCRTKICPFLFLTKMHISILDRVSWNKTGVLCDFVRLVYCGRWWIIICNPSLISCTGQFIFIYQRGSFRVSLHCEWSRNLVGDNRLRTRILIEITNYTMANWVCHENTGRIPRLTNRISAVDNIAYGVCSNQLLDADTKANWQTSDCTNYIAFVHSMATLKIQAAIVCFRIKVICSRIGIPILR